MIPPRAAVGLVLGLCFASCAPDHGEAWKRDIAAAQRAQTAGRTLEAAEIYQAACEKDAKLARDREHACYLAASLYLEAPGDPAERKRRLLAIASISPPSSYSAKAAFDLATFELAHGDAKVGWWQMESVFRRFPDHGVARGAFRHVLAHIDETEGDARAIDFLRALEPSLHASELGEDIAYQIAQHRVRLGDLQGGRDALVRVAKEWPYPRGTLFDDALFHASEIDEQLGKYPEAIADLEQMLAERETSHMIGTYQRPRYTPALLRMAELYRDRLHDRERARQAFHRLYADFTTSPLRDFALWQEAELFREEGDTGSACERLATLADEFPDSRYVPCAAERCPRVRRAAKSRSPETCRDYIKREKR